MAMRWSGSALTFRGIGARDPYRCRVDSGRAVLQLITHNVARAARRVKLPAPADFPLLAPALRWPVSAGLSVELFSTTAIEIDL